MWGTTWGELNADASFTQRTGKRSYILTGVNYFRYANPIDNNHDNFTDVTLQDRISFFSKWAEKDSAGNQRSLAMRYIYEDRWGGEMNWTKEFRGGDSIYGESIYTNRFELLGMWQLPFKERINISISYNFHGQNSVYGSNSFLADQHTGFAQGNYSKKIGWHEMLTGTSLRYIFYDDNTPATQDAITTGGLTKPMVTILPGSICAG